MDRLILFFFTYLSGRQALFRASDSGRDVDGQTNSVLFDLSVWPSSAIVLELLSKYVLSK